MIDVVDYPEGDGKPMAESDLHREIMFYIIHLLQRFFTGQRVLRPGGSLAVVDNIAPDGEAGKYVNDFEKLRDPSHHRCLGLDEWLRGFQAAGFTVLNQETALKEITFNDWVARMGATPAIVTRLRELLLHAPEAAADFLQPRQTEDDIAFYLTEVIVVGALR